MARIEQDDTKAFKPYKLCIETQEEHDFLTGLLSLGRKEIKQTARSYDSTIDWHLFNIVDNSQR